MLWVLALFLHVAGIFLLLGAEFLAAVQVIVYAGAILIFYLFVVMLLDLPERGGAAAVRRALADRRYAVGLSFASPRRARSGRDARPSWSLAPHQLPRAPQPKVHLREAFRRSVSSSSVRSPCPSRWFPWCSWPPSSAPSSSPGRGTQAHDCAGEHGARIERCPLWNRGIRLPGSAQHHPDARLGSRSCSTRSTSVLSAWARTSKTRAARSWLSSWSPWQQQKPVSVWGS